jgi:hypothetical protein
VVFDLSLTVHGAALALSVADALVAAVAVGVAVEAEGVAEPPHAVTRNPAPTATAIERACADMVTTSLLLPVVRTTLSGGPERAASNN